jgi:hypothetical protein
MTVIFQINHTSTKSKLLEEDLVAPLLKRKEMSAASHRYLMETSRKFTERFPQLPKKPRVRFQPKLKNLSEMTLKTTSMMMKMIQIELLRKT